MLLWLNGGDNSKDSPNENYGREMMELFTLGHGSGYTEKDVRNQARALTGFRFDWTDDGPVNFRYDPSRHDTGVKTIFGQSGQFMWKDSCRLCIDHPAHSSFFVQKLWSYFVPTEADRTTLAGLEAIYKSGYQVAPVVGAILKHPVLIAGPRMVKPPVVHQAGMLRRVGAGITTTDWAWIGGLSGQQLFYPPNVAGWDDTRWLDTATWRGRWWIAQATIDPYALNPGHSKKPPDAKKLIDGAIGFWHEPPLGKPTRDALHTFAHRALVDAKGADWKEKQYPPMIANALRQLIAVSPELQAA